MHSDKQLRTAVQPSEASDQTYPSLDEISRPSLTTEEAAHYLMRRPQTLRSWSSKDCGPIRPIRINGRLAWAVEDLRRLLTRHS